MATERRLIDANALLGELDKFANPMPNKSGYDFLCGVASAITEIENAPTVDAVSRGVYDQVRWERDTAIGQLEEHGIPFGGIAPDVVKVVRCKDCKHSTYTEGDVVALCERCNICIIPNHFCSYGERRTDNG